MLWTAIGLLLLPAFLFKLLTRRGRRQVWWTCGTAAPATSVAAGVVLGNGHQIDELLREPNVAVLIAGLFSVVGNACCFMFWHAVRADNAEPAILRRHMIVAAAVGLAMIGFWLIAPVHTYAYSSYRVIPVTWQLVGYAVVFGLYFIAALSYAIKTASGLLRSPEDHDPGLRDPAIRFAVGLNLPGAGLGIAGQVLYLMRLPVQAYAPETAAGLVAVGDFCLLAAMAIYAVAGMVALAGPRVAAAARHRRLIASLDPLWRRLRALYPAIALPEAPVSARLDLRAGRMLIEIGDGLSLLRVTPDHRSPIEEVAHALATVDRGPGTAPASQALPVPTTAREEEQLFVAVSEAYVKLRSAGATSSDRRKTAGAQL